MVSEFDELIAEARFYKRSVYADTTKTTYRSQMRAYLRFCIYFGRTAVPANQATLIGYVTFLARSISPRSIPCYLNVIRIMHLCAGLNNPLENNWELNLLKRGILRQKAVPPVQKLPITPDMLLKIFAQLNNSDPGDICFWAACLIAFYGFLRKSTLLQKSASEDFSKGLLRSDIFVIKAHSFSLAIRHSKTIQFGQRVLVLPFAQCKISILCPVQALFLHLTTSRLTKDWPLFAYSSGKVVRVLTHSTFSSRLKLLLGRAGYDSKLMSAHSFRSGGTSFAIGAGLNSLVVKARGDWTSNAFERYVYLTDKSTLSAARLLSTKVARSFSHSLIA